MTGQPFALNRRFLCKWQSQYNFVTYQADGGFSKCANRRHQQAFLDRADKEHGTIRGPSDAAISVIEFNEPRIEGSRK
jgi:hypothetical protein